MKTAPHYCSKCGAVLPVDAGFCEQCGRAVPAREQTVPPAIPKIQPQPIIPWWVTLLQGLTILALVFFILLPDLVHWYDPVLWGAIFSPVNNISFHFGIFCLLSGAYQILAGLTNRYERVLKLLIGALSFFSGLFLTLYWLASPRGFSEVPFLLSLLGLFLGLLVAILDFILAFQGGGWATALPGILILSLLFAVLLEMFFAIPSLILACLYVFSGFAMLGLSIFQWIKARNR